MTAEVRTSQELDPLKMYLHHDRDIIICQHPCSERRAAVRLPFVSVQLLKTPDALRSVGTNPPCTANIATIGVPPYLARKSLSEKDDPMRGIH